MYVYGLNFPTVPQQPITAIIRTSSPSIPQVGEPYSRICTVSKFPGLAHTPTAQWLKISTGTERIGMPTPNEAALEFFPLRTSDAGRYRCQGNLNTTVRSQPLLNSSDFDLISQSKSIFVGYMNIVLHSCFYSTSTNSDNHKVSL